MPCGSCTAHCCGGSALLAPILLPFEVALFKPYAVEVCPGIWRLTRRHKVCWFLNGQHCEAYSRRPIECRIYPWIFRWQKGTLSLELNGHCEHMDKFPKPEEIFLDSRIANIPTGWWEEFERLPA